MGLEFGKKKGSSSQKPGCPTKNAGKSAVFVPFGPFFSIFGGAPRFLPKTAFFSYQTLDPLQNYNNTVGIFDFRPSGRDLFALMRASVAQRVQN